MRWCLEIGTLGDNQVYIYRESGILTMGLVLLQEETLENSLLLSATQTHSEKALTTCQEESPHQNPTLVPLWSSTSSLQNCEKFNFCYLSHPVYGSSLWPPEQIKTGREELSHQPFAFPCLSLHGCPWPDLFIYLSASSFQDLPNWIHFLGLL